MAGVLRGVFENRDCFCQQPATRVIEGQIERHLRISWNFAARKMATPDIELVERSRFFEQPIGFARTTAISQKRSSRGCAPEDCPHPYGAISTRARRLWPSLGASRQFLQLVEMLRPAIWHSMSLCKKRRKLPHRGQITHREAEIVMRLAVIWIRVSRRQSLDRTGKYFSAVANSPRRKCHRPIALLQRESPGSRRKASRQ